MYIVIQYRIESPSHFWAIVEQDITKSAVDARLLQWRADLERRLCVCMWSAEPGKPLHMQFDASAYHVRVAVYFTLEEAIVVGLPEEWVAEAATDCELVDLTPSITTIPALDGSPNPRPAA